MQEQLAASLLCARATPQAIGSQQRNSLRRIKSADGLSRSAERLAVPIFCRSWVSPSPVSTNVFIVCPRSWIVLRSIVVPTAPESSYTDYALNPSMLGDLADCVRDGSGGGATEQFNGVPADQKLRYTLIGEVGVEERTEWLASPLFVPRACPRGKTPCTEGRSMWSCLRERSLKYLCRCDSRASAGAELSFADHDERLP